MAASLYGLTRFCMGDNLGLVADYLSRHGDTSICEVYSHSLVETCHNLMGRSLDPLFLSGGVIDDSSFKSLDAENRSTKLWVLFFRIFLAVYMGEFNTAESLMYQFKRFTRKLVLPRPIQKQVKFYEGLIAAVLASNVACRHRRARLNVAQKILRKLQSTKVEEDPTLRNKIFLLDAQLQACRGQHETALLLVHQSVDLAEDKGYSHEQALAYELAGRMCQMCNRTVEADLYLSQAREFYHRWGAIAKVEQIDQEIDLSSL